MSRKNRRNKRVKNARAMSQYKINTLLKPAPAAQPDATATTATAQRLDVVPFAPLAVHTKPVAVQVAEAERATKQTVLHLPVDSLHLRDYQRTTDQKRAERIAANFDVAKLGMLVVSERDGKFHLLDGAHRASALKILKYSHTLCIILHDLTYEQEAEYFRTQRDNTRSLSQFSLFKAGIEAGDPMCIAIRDAAKKYGFEIRASSKDFKSISAIHALKTVATIYGYDVLDTTLRLIRETWDGLKDATKREYIVGLADFVSRFGDPNFAANMRSKSIHVIWQEYLGYPTYYSRASTDPAMRKAFCKAIMTQFNKGLRGNKRLHMEDN